MIHHNIDDMVQIKYFTSYDTLYDLHKYEWKNVEEGPNIAVTASVCKRFEVSEQSEDGG